MKKHVTLIIAILSMATLSFAGRPCLAPICSMAFTPGHGSAPFTANIRYTLAGVPATIVFIDYSDGTIEQLPANVRTGNIQHMFVLPGLYTPNLNVYNDCGGFIVQLTIEVQ